MGAGIVAPVVFSTRIDIRVSDLDAQLHVAGYAYHQFADQARWACLQAAGVSIPDMIGAGFGPVNLETVLKFQRELRGGETVEVSCAWIWGAGKTYRLEHVFTRSDGEIAATVGHVSGVLDLRRRKLVADPAAAWRERTGRPELLGLT